MATFTSLLSLGTQEHEDIADTFRESQPAWQGVKKVYFPSTQIGSNSSNEHAEHEANSVEQESAKFSL